MKTKINIITDCLDLLADFENQKPKEQLNNFQQIIDVLGSYPKPQQKIDFFEATIISIGAYLFISNVRNACKLSILGYLKNIEAYTIAQQNCELALSLFVDDLEVIEPETVK